ncbi:MAG: VTT domain-containing protein [Gammaproteobacteria bacterium]
MEINLLIILGFAILECAMIVGIFLPGMGPLWAAVMGAGLAGQPLTSVILMIFIGGMIGDLSSWAIAKFIYNRIDLNNLKLKNAQEKTTWVMKKYGVFGIVLGKSFGPIRGLLPLIAAMTNYPKQKYIFATSIGTIIWALVASIPSYYAGVYTSAIGENYQQIIYVSLYLFILIFTIWFLIKFLMGKNDN